MTEQKLREALQEMIDLAEQVMNLDQDEKARIQRAQALALPTAAPLNDVTVLHGFGNCPHADDCDSFVAGVMFAEYKHDIRSEPIGKLPQFDGILDASLSNDEAEKAERVAGMVLDSLQKQAQPNPSFWQVRKNEGAFGWSEWSNIEDEWGEDESLAKDAGEYLEECKKRIEDGDKTIQIRPVFAGVPVSSKKLIGDAVSAAITTTLHLLAASTGDNKMMDGNHDAAVIWNGSVFGSSARVTVGDVRVIRDAILQSGADARDAQRYRRIRNGPYSDRHGDIYAMVFAGMGDFPIKGQDLDNAVDQAIARGNGE